MGDYANAFRQIENKFLEVPEKNIQQTWQHPARWGMSTVRLLVDLTSIYLAGLLAKGDGRLFGISWVFDSFEQILPFGLVCVWVGALLSQFSCDG